MSQSSNKKKDNKVLKSVIINGTEGLGDVEKVYAVPLPKKARLFDPQSVERSVDYFFFSIAKEQDYLQSLLFKDYCMDREEKKPTIFLANSHAQLMQRALFSIDQAPLLCKCYAVVESPLVEYQWKLAMLQNKGSLGICTLTLQQLLSTLFPSTHFPDRKILALYIEGWLKKTETFKTQDEAIMADVGKTLALEFWERAFYGAKKPLLDWQEPLWKEVWQKWDAYEKLLTFPLPQEPLQIHLIDVGPLSEIMSTLFHRLEKKHGLFYYHLCSSPLYVGDLHTDSRRFFFKQKAQNNKETAEDFLEESSYLLRNFGEHERIGFAQLEDKEGVWLDAMEEIAITSKLSSVQSAIALCEKEENFFQQEDATLTCSSFDSGYEEIRHLRSVICQDLADGAFAHEITVLAPNIEKYISFIEMFFSEQGAYQSFGKKISSPSLVNLLTFLQSRFSLEDVEALLKDRGLSAFQSASEKELIIKWGKQGNLRWGTHALHKASALLDTCGKQIQEEDVGSWNFVLTRLLLSLAANKMPGFVHTSISLTDAPFLYKLIAWFEGLELARATIFSERKSIKDWLYFLFKLTKEYLNELAMPFFIEIKEKLHRLLEETTPLHFSCIYKFLEASTEYNGSYVGSHHLSKITFSSIKRGGIGNVKRLYLIGMDEESFPRVEKAALSNKIPQSVEDRGFLLRALMAPTHLKISYVHLNADGKKQRLSPYLEEILLKAEIKQSPISSKTSGKFEEQNPFATTPLRLKDTEEESLDLQELMRFAAHPIRFFYRSILGIYLERFKVPFEEELSLSGKVKWRIRQAVKRGEAPLERLELEGALPSGYFSSLGSLEWEKAQQKYEEQLQRFEVGRVECIDLDGMRVGKGEIVGTIEGVSDKGLLIEGKNTLATWVENYPKILIFWSLFPEKGILFLEDGAACDYLAIAPDHLEAYLRYFYTAKQTPSPLLPLFSKAFLADGKLPSFQNQDPYLSKVAPSLTEFFESIKEAWSPVFQQIFSPVTAVMETHAFV